MKSLSQVWYFVTPWTVAHQAPVSMGFSRQEYWSGLPFPSPGDLPNPWIEPRSSRPRDWTGISRIAGRRFTIWATREVSVEVSIEERSSPKPFPQLNFTMWKPFADIKTRARWPRRLSRPPGLWAPASRLGLPPAAPLPVRELMSSRAPSHSLGGQMCPVGKYFSYVLDFNCLGECIT